MQLIIDDIVNLASEQAEKKLIRPPHDVNAEMARHQTMKRTKVYSSSSSDEDIAEEYSFKFLNMTSNGISSNNASLFTNIIQDIRNKNKVRELKVNSWHLVELECNSSYQADRVVKKLKMLSFNQQIIKG